MRKRLEKKACMCCDDNELGQVGWISGAMLIPTIMKSIIRSFTLILYPVGGIKSYNISTSS